MHRGVTMSSDDPAGENTPPTENRTPEEPNTPPKASPSTGWQETAEAMHAVAGIGEFIDEFRDDLEKIGEEAHVISPVVQALLDRHDRGEVEC